MVSFGPVDNIAHNIQLAVAPVFLLTGIGSVLNVLVTRLGRVIDRARKVEAEIDGYSPAMRGPALADLTALDRRMAVVHWAIGMCTTSALFVCILIALLFVGNFIEIKASGVVALLFIAAMGFLICGLILFLAEVQIATRSVRVKGALLAEQQANRRDIRTDQPRVGVPTIRVDVPTMPGPQYNSVK